MSSVVWSGWEGGMSPVAPTSVENPVTLIENMTLRDDGVLTRRSGFASNTFAQTPRNHIVCNLAELTNPALVLKVDTGWYYKTSSGAPVALDASGLPIALRTPEGGSRGSFCVFGEELYYCDKESIWRWNGDGVLLSETGMPYFDLGDPSAVFTYCATLDPVDDPLWWLYDCEFNGDCEQIDPGCKLRAGAKSGSFSVSYSWYDRVRNIYGPRSKPLTTVIAAYSGGPVRLFGWSLTIPTPTGTDYSATYDVVVWASQSVSIKLLQRTFNLSNGQIEYTLSHQVGDELSDLHFYEGTAGAVGEEFVLRKDNAALAKAGPALDVYERPHPSQHMLVLTDGTTLYFGPNTAYDKSGEYRYAIEYSVGHPEQIGRDSAHIDRRAANGPTITYAANQKGRAVASISSSGGEAVLLTDQEVYVVRFSQGVVDLIPQGQNRGVRSAASITESPMGLSYLSDEGHVLIAGGASELIDQQLGYGTYLQWLDESIRAVMAGGSCGSSIFLWMPDFDPFEVARGGTFDTANHRSALVYEHTSKFLCKFRLGTQTSIVYAAGAKLDDGSRIFAYNGAKELYWPSAATADDGSNFSSRVVMWLSENPNVTKHIRSVVVTYGNVDANETASGPEVVVRGMDHWNDPEHNVTLQRASSTNYRAVDVKNRRVVYSDFDGMQGRVFQIEVRTDSGTSGTAWTTGTFDLVSVAVEYESEEEEGHLGAPGLDN